MPPKMKTTDKRLYRTYTSNTDDREAVQAYQRKHGKEPRKVFRALGLLWLGPVDEENQE